MLPLEVDRVLKGPEVRGRSITPDQLPFFDCTPGEKFIPASTGLKPGTHVVAYLNRKGTSWALESIEPLTPRFQQLLDAATGDDPTRELRPLLSATDGGIDNHAKMMIELYLTKEPTRELLLDVLKSVPESLKKSDQEARDAIIGWQLVPAASMLANENDPRLLRPVLDALPYVEQKALYVAHRGYLYHALGATCLLFRLFSSA